MNIYQLYYFRTLAYLEHYTKAAEQLCLAQPSLSHAINALEEDLGVPLFKKKGRNVVLTQYGKEFLQYVESCLNELETGINKIKELSAEINSTVNIGFIYTLTNWFIPNLINKFHETNENIKIILHEGHITECTPGLVRNLKQERLDLIFASLIPNDPEINFEPLFQQRLVCLISDKNPLSAKAGIDLKDVENIPFIHYRGKTGLKNEIDRLFQKIQTKPNVLCELEDELSILNLVSTNLGLAIIPENSMYDKICRDRGIQIKPIVNPDYTRMIYMGSLKDRHHTSSVKSFLEFVIECKENNFQLLNHAAI